MFFLLILRVEQIFFLYLRIMQNHILAILLLLLLNCGLNAQELGRFDHYSTKEGLISNRVFGLAKDADGFVWAATDFGLERFDGQFFKHYKKSVYEEMPRENFQFVSSFENGNLCAGGYNGLLLEYDVRADSFRNVMPEEFNSSFFKESIDLYKDEKGNYYLFTSAGIYPYSKTERVFSSDSPIFKATKDFYVCAMFIDKYDRVWAGSVDSVCVFDKAGNKVELDMGEKRSFGFIKGFIYEDDKLYMTTQANEMLVFDITEGKISKPKIVSVPFANVSKVMRDKTGRYWFATDGDGLWHTSGSQIKDLKFLSVMPFNAQHDEFRKIYAITEDNMGDIWVGTQNSGVWRYRINDQKVMAMSENYGFPASVCSSFLEDDGTLYVGSDGIGIFSMPLDFSKFSLKKFDNNNILHMTKTPDGELWVATWGGGVYRINLESGNVINEPFEGIENPCKCYFSICSYGDEMYACTAGDGLYMRKGGANWSRVPLEGDSLSKQSNRWVYHVCEGRDGVRWVISTNTLWWLKDGKARATLPDVNIVKSYVPLSVNDGVCDEDGYFFAATSSGVLKFAPDGSSYEKLDFLPDVGFSTILRDNDGLFWVAGSNYVYSFDYKKKTVWKLPGDYENLPNYYFYSRAGIKDSNGILHLGTNGGFLSFNPEKLADADEIELFRFSDLYISEEKVKKGEGVLANGDLNALGKLTLDYDKSNVTICFDLIDFSDFDCVQLRYKLEGVSDKWIELGRCRSVNFTHIPEGSCRLVVEAYRTSLDSKSKTIVLNIEVRPPWWNTLWFKLVLILAVALAVYLYFYARTKRLVQEQKILSDKVDERTVELSQALNEKDRLISVVGHDLKNPMFAIVTALESLKDKGSVSTAEDFKVLSDVLGSAKTLQGEMVKLLDWANAGQKDIVCKKTDASVELSVDNVHLLLKDLIEKKKLLFRKDIGLEHFAFVDERMLEIVLRNVLNNAIKFTPEGGRIDVIAKEQEDVIVIEVKDSGVGMSEEKVKKLLSSGKNESSAGTNGELGSGLGFGICKEYVQRNGGTVDIESRKNEGTVVRLALPASVKRLHSKKHVGNAKDKIAPESLEMLQGNVVLVVDDDKLICEGMKALLEKHVAVFTANNGIEALELLKQHDFDIILSDVEMPEMSGVEMCEVIRQSAAFKHIPILFLSARTAESDRLLGLLSGAIDYIPKPFSQDELFVKLCNILNMRKLQQERFVAQFMKNTDSDMPLEKTEETEADPFLEKYLGIIKLRYSESDLSVDSLADAMCVSRATLSRRTKAILGKTPIELLNEFRLNEAMRMLKGGRNSQTVSDVAFASGFNDLAYFSKRFKERFGVSPSAVK